MNKMKNLVMATLGVVFMGALAVFYSFSTIEIPAVFYMVLWCACIGIVRLAIESDAGLER